MAEAHASFVTLRAPASPSSSFLHSGLPYRESPSPLQVAAAAASERHRDTVSGPRKPFAQHRYVAAAPTPAVAVTLKMAAERKTLSNFPARVRTAPFNPFFLLSPSLFTPPPLPTCPRSSPVSQEREGGSAHLGSPFPPACRDKLPGRFPPPTHRQHLTHFPRRSAQTAARNSPQRTRKRLTDGRLTSYAAEADRMAS